MLSEFTRNTQTKKVFFSLTSHITGDGYLDQRQKSSLKNYWVNKLEKLGFKVNVEEEPMEKAA